MHQETFVLTDGSLEPKRDADGIISEVGLDFQNVSYGDVNGDGREEAIVVLSMTTGGSAIPHWVYIYTPGRPEPLLLWAFETGDRADAGLHRVYARRGDLVLELHSPEGSKGACCPVKFTRTRYRWTGARFCPTGKPEVVRLMATGKK